MTRTPTVARHAVTLLTAAVLPLTAATTASAADFPLQRWLDEPDIKLVAVEFYADWCGLCKESAPRWEDLRRRYAAHGLKLVVVNVTEKAAGDKRCSGLPWNPDVSLCDPAIGERLGVKGLPEAFVWSWQGNLLVERGQHVDKIEQIIKRYLDDNPRVQVEATDLKGKPDAALRRAVESALGRSGKLTVVPDAEMRARLAALRKESHRAARRDDQRCPLGAEVSANSLLRVERFEGTLSLRVLDAVSGCQRATASVPWDDRGADRTADKAVYNLLQRLKRAQVQLPEGVAGARDRVATESDKWDTGAGDWTPEGEELATVSFASDPAGAMVMVDNKPLCQTPCTKGLSSGNHRVAMHKPEYVSRDESVALAGGKTVSWALAADFALLTVTTEPAGVAVTVDGKAANAGEALRLSPGQHEVVAQDKCHAAHRKTVALKRGEVRSEVLQPVVKSAGLTVLAYDGRGSAVQGAEVWVDGMRAGAAFDALAVGICAKEVEVRHVSLGTARVALSLVEQQVLRLKVKLGGETAALAEHGRVTWVRVPAGTFLIGSPEDEPGHKGNEGPQHQVTITRPFLLSATEVTQGQWRALMGNNPSTFKGCGDSCPVENVSWWDAVAYCNKLSRREKRSACYSLNGCRGTPGAGNYACRRVRFVGPSCRGYRLPTEAEWEYAARAGTTTAVYTGGITTIGKNNAPELDAIAWYGGNSGVSYPGGFDCSRWGERASGSPRCGPQSVGGRQANALGLYDMIGNVWEWTGDFYGAYRSRAQRDPTGPSRGSGRVRRGCGWDFSVSFCRAASRVRDAPDLRDSSLGFRPSRSVP